MLNIIKTAALSAFIGLGALAAVPATAQADGLYLNFGGHHQPRVGVFLGDSSRDRYDRRDHRRACSPNRALDKAERLGLRRAYVTDVNRHTIKVRGRKHGDRVTLVFGRSQNCPIVRW